MKAKLLIGNNTLNLCPATMTAVVQAWLDEELASPIEVKGVKWRNDSGVQAFEVRFERRNVGEDNA